jgi:hypothetical protein|eukprot:evm.model.NODE_10827_length_17461_cov_27.031786.2
MITHPASCSTTAEVESDLHNTSGIAAVSGIQNTTNDKNREDGELPTPFQLWRHIFADILFGNSLLRDLVYWDMALHLFCWTCFACMLWAFFLGFLPFNLAFKIYFFGSMGIFVSELSRAEDGAAVVCLLRVRVGKVI